ncbi:MAG: Tripartite tricarboxylate transporter TctB family protein [Clostridium sp.]|jgi:hypothetical protein
MHKGDTIPGLLFCAVGVMFLIPGMGLGLTSTVSGVPGAGFFPVIVAVAVILFGAALFVKGLKDNGKLVYFKMDEEQKANVKPLILTVSSIVVFFVLWKFVHFVVAALVFCLFMNWVYKRNWKFNIIFSIVFVTLIYCIFNIGLKVQFAI